MLRCVCYLNSVKNVFGLKHRMVITFLFFFAMNHQGVSASHEMYKGRITSAGQRYGVDPAVLGGIVSRESRGGTGLNLQFHWRSLLFFEVDKRCHSPKGGGGGHGTVGNMSTKGTQMLVGSYSDYRTQLLSSYNMGAGSISSYEQVDAKTTGGNYANDVVARAEYLKKTWLLKVSQAD
uniref:Uncharacterized protein n=1 Tax=Oncorhynchus kisutch TaxID=8019 RepID=A0A8C7IRL8_ONCKI